MQSSQAKYGGFQAAVARDILGANEADIPSQTHDEPVPDGEHDGLIPAPGAPPPPRAYPQYGEISTNNKFRQFRFWARMCTLILVCIAYAIGAIVSFAANILIGIGIYTLFISIPIFIVEGQFFSIVIPSVPLRKILHSYYTRAICYFVLAFPGFFFAGTVAGSIFLNVSAILYLVAAIRKEGADEQNNVDFSGIV